MRTARIIGTGSYLGKRIVTNRELESRIKGFDLDEAKETLSKRGVDVANLSSKDIFDMWAKQVTGIEKRHFYDNDFNNNENYIGDTENMGFEAAKLAIKSANISVKELDYIIFSTFTPEDIIPNPSCSLAGLLNTNIGAIPINTACSGFIDGLIDAYCRIKSGHYNTILVVAAETLTKKTNYNDPKTSVLFADGAGAVILQAAEKGIISFHTETDYSATHIRLKDGGLIEMGGGPDVLKKAVNAMKKMALKSLEKSPYNMEDIKYVIPHQANARIIKKLAKSLNLPEGKLCETIEELGNTSGASVAITLDKLIKGKIKGYKVKEGNKLMLTSVGGGYTLASLLMEY